MSTSFHSIKKFIWQYPITTMTTLVISTLFFIIGAVPELLFFNHFLINEGQWWRWLTAHLVHSDLEHLFWNLTAFIILSLLIETHSRVFLIIAFVSGIIAIDYFLWFNTIGVINYAGLSGVLNTLLVVALYLQWQRASNQPVLMKLIPLLVYLASLSKIIVELFSQQSLFTHIHWLPLPQAHLVGFFAGTLLILSHITLTNVKYVNYPIKQLHNYQKK